MKREGYGAARIVAPEVFNYFSRRLALSLEAGEENLAHLPSVETIEALIDAAFWASLRREESYTPKISLAVLAPEQSGHPLVLERPLAVDPAILTRVAPAVERAGIHLGVWGEREELCIWGTTRALPKHCFVLEVSAPGLLVIKHHGGLSAGKFENVAVLEGDQIKLVNEQLSKGPECPAMLSSLLGFGSPATWAESANVLVQLAISMRAQGRGGCILVVPAESESWRESIVLPLAYAASPPFSALTQLSEGPRDQGQRDDPKSELRRTVDWIAGLAAVDGAVVLNDRHELLGFGAKIARRRRFPQVEKVTVREPIRYSVPTQVHPERLGGTRHLSAAQFVQDQRDAIALVASQDGRFTVFEWSPCEEMVQGHRVETLLL